VWLYAETHDDLDLMPWHPAASFQVAGPDLDPAPRAVVRLSPVHVRSAWERIEDQGAGRAADALTVEVVPSLKRR